MTEAFLGIAAAMLTTSFGAALGWFISSRSASAQWKRDRRDRERDRIESLTEELHLAVMRVLMLSAEDRARKDERWREMKDAMVLTSARTRRSSPQLSQLIHEFESALQASQTDFDLRSVLTGLAALTATQLEDPDSARREGWTLAELVEMGAAQERRRRGLGS